MALKYKNGIIMLVEKRIPNTLVIPESVEKIFKINDNIACSTSGLVADARILADYAREDVAYYKTRYGEEIPVAELVKRISNIKRIYTQYGGIRPFGVAFLIGGIDENDIYLFETDPSGAYKQYSAGAIGEGRDDAVVLLEDNYQDNMNFKDAMNLTILAASAALKRDIKKANAEVVTITKKDGFKKMKDEDVMKLKKRN